ncbi:hypothetical protein [Microbacterium sp. Mcb102]|uniref:hypothetical protein n=1 Tax=Microbacterium sp. Mcb102 TaxID=2926012 RepID=UPI0021C745F6|nr:hypothetical protein [Microbacterium sp. Mcb102]
MSGRLMPASLDDAVAAYMEITGNTRLAATESVGLMEQIRLDAATTRHDLLATHRLLAAVDGGPVALTLGDDLHPTSPGQFSAWLQLVFTWGQDTLNRVLVLPSMTVARVRHRHPLSDVELVAVLLADTIISDNIVVTAELQPLAKAALTERRVLTSHSGDGDGATQSLLLAAHTFTNRSSPELHAPADGRLGIEETARTLYHDLWPSPAPVRKPLLEFGEQARRVGDDVYVTRTLPTSDVPGTPFRNLGSRAPQVRGLALELASKVRVRQKPLHDEVGEILFELVQNTEWHASQRAGGRTGANYRSLTFREYTYTPQTLNRAGEFDRNFAAYLRDVARDAQTESGRSITRMTFGSITVVDSGVGLARSVARSLGEEHLLNEGTEVKYLTRALAKHLKRRRVDLGNIGLARVQQSLTTLRGYMSVRTGSVEILRNFVDRPFDPVMPDVVNHAQPPLMLDWIPLDPDDFVVGPRLGTAVTITYPVDFEVNP